jgi:UDP-N-acetylglucosamine acyltransferase
VIHATAIVHPKAQIGPGVEIGPYCLVGENVTIGARTQLLGHVVVNGNTTIGEDTVIYPFASIGMPSQDRKYRGEVAFTTIGSRTTLREYVSVHRATGEGETTSVGDDTLLLAYVHIAHNCRIGDFVTMSSTAQLAGHVIVENYANIGGHSGVHQFTRIGTYAMVGGASAISKDCPPYFITTGNPAEVRGLNMVGLKRAGFSSETLAELKECYRLLYRAGLNVTQAVEAMQSHVTTEEGRNLIGFLVAPSERGVTK